MPGPSLKVHGDPPVTHSCLWTAGWPPAPLSPSHITPNNQCPSELRYHWYFSWGALRSPGKPPQLSAGSHLGLYPAPCPGRIQSKDQFQKTSSPCPESIIASLPCYLQISLPRLDVQTLKGMYRVRFIPRGQNVDGTAQVAHHGSNVQEKNCKLKLKLQQVVTRVLVFAGRTLLVNERNYLHWIKPGLLVQ